MQLDTPTLAAVSMVGGAMFSVTLAGVWLTGTRERCALSWAVAGMASAAGYLVGVSATEPWVLPYSWMAIALANALIGLSHALIFVGVRQFLGRPSHVVPICIGLALLFAAGLASEELRTSMRSRVLIQSAAYLLLDVAAAVALLRRPLPGLEVMQGVLAAVLSAYALFLATRWTWLLVHPGVGDATGYDPLQAAVFPLTLVFNLALSSCVVLLLYRRKELDLRALARLDALTGLGNRAALDAESAIEVARARRQGDPVSVVMVDLDHFKGVNDTHGHGVGDAVLRTAALELGSDLRDTDRAFRVGGEEYLLLLPNTTADSAMGIAERLRLRFERARIPTPSGPLCVTASFGVAQLGPGEEWASLLDRTDRALYLAKREGRNRVAVSDGLAWSGPGGATG